jgi:alpha-tubulin suppressor-like RCC1 family protein
MKNATKKVIAKKIKSEMNKQGPGCKILKISAGGDHNLVITEDGYMFAFGYNVRG